MYSSVEEGVGRHSWLPYMDGSHYQELMHMLIWLLIKVCLPCTSVAEVNRKERHSRAYTLQLQKKKKSIG